MKLNFELHIFLFEFFVFIQCVIWNYSIKCDSRRITQIKRNLAKIWFLLFKKLTSIKVMVYNCCLSMVEIWCKQWKPLKQIFAVCNNLYIRYIYGNSVQIYLYRLAYIFNILFFIVCIHTLWFAVCCLSVFWLSHRDYVLCTYHIFIAKSHQQLVTDSIEQRCRWVVVVDKAQTLRLVGW